MRKPNERNYLTRYLKGLEKTRKEFNEPKFPLEFKENLGRGLRNLDFVTRLSGKRRIKQEIEKKI